MTTERDIIDAAQADLTAAVSSLAALAGHVTELHAHYTGLGLLREANKVYTMRGHLTSIRGDLAAWHGEVTEKLYEHDPDLAEGVQGSGGR